jgi:CCR4-NOT transcription complex subunit 4
MCRFCWHHIKENLNGKCPACRQPYNPENYTFTPPNLEEYELFLTGLIFRLSPPLMKISNECFLFCDLRIQRLENEKKQQERLKKLQELEDRKQLANMRVLQRNLVYVTNLALSIAKEEVHRSEHYVQEDMYN